MAHAITIELLQLLEDKLGKEEGRKVAEAIEASFEAIDKKVEASTFQRKLELKDELTKELANKADIVRLDGKIETIRQEMQTMKSELEKKIDTELLRLDRKFTIMFIILFFTIIFLNQNALEFMARILGLIK